MSIVIPVLFTVFLLVFAAFSSLCALAMVVSINPVSIKERPSDWMYVVESPVVREVK
jgi:hypothetical protein